MAARKRRKRNTAKRASRNQGGLPGAVRRLFRRGLILLFAFFAVVAGLYFLGPQPVRQKIGQLTTILIDRIRHQEWMPAPMERALDQAHDAVSRSEGLLVDGGELGFNADPLLAGLPECRQPTRVLRNVASVNLFDEASRMTRCIALRLPAAEGSPPAGESLLERLPMDPRVPDLRTGQMTDGPWTAQPLFPPDVLSASLKTGNMKDVLLPTSALPMREPFLEDIWKALMQEISVRYPERYGEVWLYVGPVLAPGGDRLASGIPVPEHFYAIVFDITAGGWLRAIAFLVPHENPPQSIAECITSIEAIESLTGMRFLPELNQEAYSRLRQWVSPRLW